MGRFPGGGDDDAKALFPGGAGEGSGLLRCAVGGIDVDLVGHAVVPELVDGLLYDRQVAVAAHDDTDFFHDASSLSVALGRGLALRDEMENGSPILFL